MTDREATPRMTTDEVALVREIAQWRRAQGISYWRARRPLGRFIVWAEPAAPRRRTEVVWDPSAAPRELGYGTRETSNEYVRAKSVTQAVDILVALGLLPERFGSAYRAGWLAREDAIVDSAHGGFGSYDPRIRPAGLR